MSSDESAAGSSDEDAELRKEIDQVERHASRTVELGGRAVVIAVAVFVLIIGEVLPWMNGANGLGVFVGQGEVTGRDIWVPRLFATTSLAFGVLASALTLMTRRWMFAWACAIGGWFASVDGVLAIWSRRSTDSEVGIGLIVAEVAMVVLASQWFRVAWSRT